MRDRLVGDFGPSTVLAVLAGVVLAVVAFVPVVAHRYRTAGRLRFLDLAMLLAVAVYAMALWTYTLIPVPETADYACARANLTPFAFLDDIRSTRGGGRLLTNAALLQAAFNVLLFLPLGAFLRWVAKRGVVLATLAGFAISAVIELTQKTGVWGLFHCAYRVFDVDDLMLNTAGALLGSLLAWPFAALAADAGPVTHPTRVTLGRRLIGALVDVMIITFVSFSLVVTWNVAENLYLHFIPADEAVPGPPEVIDTALPRSLLGWLPALLVEGLWVLASGRTCGEAVVALRPVEPARWAWPRRLVKLAVGVGAYIALTTIEWDWTIVAVAAFGVASLVAVLATKDHRGLSGLAAGLPMAPDPRRAGVNS